MEAFAVEGNPVASDAACCPLLLMDLKRLGRLDGAAVDRALALGGGATVLGEDELRGRVAVWHGAEGEAAGAGVQGQKGGPWVM